jgi:hypothetical protein
LNEVLLAELIAGLVAAINPSAHTITSKAITTLNITIQVISTQAFINQTVTT